MRALLCSLFYHNWGHVFKSDVCKLVTFVCVVGVIDRLAGYSSDGRAYKLSRDRTVGALH